MMVKKHSTPWRSLTSCIAFLSVFLIGISCANDDHVVPETPQPQPVQINTLNISGNVHNGFNYSVQFSNLGNIPITEYGIVTYAGEPGDVKIPTVEANHPLYDRKYAFTGAGYMPPNLAAKTITKVYDGPTGTIDDPTVRLKYRAYAKLNNNAVVYGEVKFIDFDLAPNNNIKPVIKTLDASRGGDGEAIVYALQFESLGNVPVAEYGIVIYQGKQTEQQTPEVPTDNVLEKKYSFTDVPTLNQKSVIKFYDGPTDDPIRVFYRAYAMLGNGEVVYGEVKFLDFEIFVPAVVLTKGVGKASGDIYFQLEFASLGNNPITEYGIVYTSFANPTASSAPTVADNKKIFSKPLKVGFIGEFFPFDPMGKNYICYRAYAIHENGEIVYSSIIGDFTY